MLRWIYPVTCAVCGEASAQSVCESCLAGLWRVPHPICLYCGAPTQGTASVPDKCEACSPFPRVYSWARSALVLEGETRRLVHDLKYHGAGDLAAPLASVLAQLWAETPFLHQVASLALVPVPIDSRRTHERGYNQAALLASALGSLVGVPVVQPLCRHLSEEDKRSMTRMSARARLQQANKVYAVEPAWQKHPKPLPSHLVLVDDVYTTGATSRACARALSSLPGVESVGVLTLARSM